MLTRTGSRRKEEQDPIDHRAFIVATRHPPTTSHHSATWMERVTGHTGEYAHMGRMGIQKNTTHGRGRRNVDGSWMNHGGGRMRRMGIHNNTTLATRNRSLMHLLPLRNVDSACMETCANSYLNMAAPPRPACRLQIAARRQRSLLRRATARDHPHQRRAPARS